MAIDHMHTRRRIALDIKQRTAPRRPTHRPNRAPFRQQQHKRASSVSVRRTGWRLRAHRAV